MGKRRRISYDESQSSRGAVALFVGAIVLLLASGALVVAMVRQGASQQGADPAPTGTTLVAAAPTGTATTVPATNTPPPPTATNVAAATARPATPTVRAATATVARAASPATPPRATPGPPMTIVGSCAVALPAGFAEEKPGYYPAADDRGFVALDPFDLNGGTNGGERTTAEIAQSFVDGTLKLALQEYRQTAASSTDDGSRVEYTASAGGKPGRGVVVVRRVGDVACGVTLFALNDSPLPFEQTLDALLASLQSARP
jgi:hypothetical protein